MKLHNRHKTTTQLNYAVVCHYRKFVGKTKNRQLDSIL